MNSAAEKDGHPRTHLFTLRIWREGAGVVESELRIQVQHVISGDTHYFRAWELLAAYLRDKISQLDDEGRGDANGDACS